MNRPPWDDDLDLNPSERWNVFVGFVVVICFVLFVTVVAAGT